MVIAEALQLLKTVDSAEYVSADLANAVRAWRTGSASFEPAKPNTLITEDVLRASFGQAFVEEVKSAGVYSRQAIVAEISRILAVRIVAELKAEVFGV